MAAKGSLGLATPKPQLIAPRQSTKMLGATHRENAEPRTGESTLTNGQAPVEQERSAQLAQRRTKAEFAEKMAQASVLHSFTATEEVNPTNFVALGALGLIDVGLIAYFAFTDNFLAALVFLITGGLIAFTIFTKQPRTVTCKIRTQGVQVNKDLYLYENLRSFWIFYDPPYHQELSIRSRKSLVNFIRVPLGDEDPVKIRKLLLQFLPERRQEMSLGEAVGRLIGF